MTKKQIKEMSEKITINTRTIDPITEDVDFKEKKQFQTICRKEILTCNQCGEEFEYHTEVDGKASSVCANPECPNYALYQIPVEMMPKNEE